MDVHCLVGVWIQTLTKRVDIKNTIALSCVCIVFQNVCNIYFYRTSTSSLSPPHHVCIPAEFFLCQMQFLFFLLIIFGIIYFANDEIWLQKYSDLNFWQIFFIIFTNIFGHCDLDLWPKVTNFDRVRASVVSSHLAKTASKSMHPFGWNFVHKNSGHTDRHTDTQTNCNENITPPRFRGDLIIEIFLINKTSITRFKEVMTKE